MLNLAPSTGATAAPIPYSSRAHAGRTLTPRRGARLNVGADHVDPEYLAPVRVAARRAELVAAGYRPDLATLAVRLEGRENTLLDAVDGAGLTNAEERELAAVQALLWTLHRERIPQDQTAPAEVLA